MSPSSPPGRLARLADLVFRRRRLVLVAWVVGLVAAFGAAGLAGEWSADYSTPGSESRAAADLLDERFPQQSPRDRRHRLARARRRRRRRRARADRCARGPVGGARGHRPQPRAPRRRSSRPTGRSGCCAFPLTELPGAIPTTTGESLIDLAERTAGPGLRVELDGQVIANAQQSEISSETIGLAIAALVLLITFGSVVAAGLPLATALFGLGISSAVVGLLAAVMDVPGLGAGARLDARDRRGDRLRPADRHPLPGRARRGPRAARRGERERGHGRPVRADRGHDRRDLPARPVPDGPPLPLRRRAVGDRGGADRDGGVDHAGPRAARDGRAEDRPAPHPGHGPRAGRSRLHPRRALEPRGAAAAVDGGDRRRRRCCSRSPRRSAACGSASPTAATTRRTPPPARPTTWSRRASAAAPTARCCSWRTRRAAGKTASPRWPRTCAGSRASPRSPSPS